MGYYRRKKQPSQYRFLLELQWCAYGLLSMFAIDQISNIPCHLQSLGPIPSATCRAQLPDFLWYIPLGLFAFGIVACAYRYYRDFHVGDYYRDCDM